MNLLKIARSPAIGVSPKQSVSEAVAKMVEHKVGAVAVTDNGKLAGIFTERDLMHKVVHRGLSAQETAVDTVMTQNPVSAPRRMGVDEAFAFMTDQHFRHIPIVDENGVVEGMLSVRHLMQSIAEHISHELESLNAYIAADGIGG